jgi:hypothetical protein
MVEKIVLRTIERRSKASLELNTKLSRSGRKGCGDPSNLGILSTKS